MTQSQAWWRNAVIYQIYPRSFQDTNNDGIGDLNGITNRLEYLADLGIDALWISPFFKSPMKDFGYDVSDYRDIDPIFGTMEDFEDLLERAHILGLKVIIDLVLSHTSDQHPWFHDPAKKDWYVWADPKDGALPNNWVSVFGGPAWEWDDRYNQYYFHNFLKEQPDLNFHNPEVQNEILDICKFWLDKGVDGFRLDVVNFYFHDQQLRNNPKRSEELGFATQFESVDDPYSKQAHIYDKTRPENIGFIRKLRQLSDQYEDRILMGEIGDDSPYHCARVYTQEGLLHTTYNPQLMSGSHKELTSQTITDPIEEFYNAPKGMSTGWPSWAFSNHDVVRAASRWYKEYDHHPHFSKMLIALLGCLPGSIIMYQGEELGLPEAQIPFEKLQDPWAKETWPTWQGRDGCRTPFPWNEDDSTNYGFSPYVPWLPIPESHHSLTQKAQSENTYSTYNFSKAFLNWRKRNRYLFNADYEFRDTSHLKIIHLIRKNDKNDTHCIFNLSDENIEYQDKKLSPFGFHIDGFNAEEDINT